jgi:hypothetical protein
MFLGSSLKYSTAKNKKVLFTTHGDQLCHTLIDKCTYITTLKYSL